MTTIHIAASREYDVVIEPGLLTRLGTMAAELGLGRRAAVISDDAVFALYGAAAEKALTDAGFQVDHFLFPHGEQQKNLSTYGQVLNFLCDRRFTRSDFLVALGGGVVGDLAGFAAATYQRGIPYIQVPTTLLSMVDSSVGGKTAVDLEHGKNQAGCFYQPSLVLCDPSLLNTLPEREYRAGCAEIIKYAMLYSEDFLRELEKTPVREQFERVISVCVGMKRDVVRGDEFDRGQRALLNLGHTVGHAVEACSGFTLLHGEGVAIGMAIITRAAVEKGLCTLETLPRLLAVLERYGLPTETDYSLTDILAAAAADKKRTDDVTKFIVPERVGHCRVEPVPADEVAGWLDTMRKAGVRLTIVSNGAEKRVRPFAQKLGLAYLYRSAKPLPFALMAAQHRMGVKHSQMAMVGDQLYADRMAAALYGIPGLMVIPRGPDLGAQVILKRKWEKKHWQEYYDRGGKTL